jgi:hypothetical protein
MRKFIAAGLFAAGLAFSASLAGGALADPAKALSIDTPIEEIVAVPAGKDVLDKDIPGLTTHAMYEQFKSMSLKDLQPMSQGQITDDQVKKVSDDLAALKP